MLNLIDPQSRFEKSVQPATEVESVMFYEGDPDISGVGLDLSSAFDVRPDLKPERVERIKVESAEVEQSRARKYSSLIVTAQCNSNESITDDAE